MGIGASTTRVLEPDDGRLVLLEVAQAAGGTESGACAAGERKPPPLAPATVGEWRFAVVTEAPTNMGDAVAEGAAVASVDGGAVEALKMAAAASAGRGCGAAEAASNWSTSDTRFVGVARDAAWPNAVAPSAAAAADESEALPATPAAPE